MRKDKFEPGVLVRVLAPYGGSQRHGIALILGRLTPKPNAPYFFCYRRVLLQGRIASVHTDDMEPLDEEATG